MHIFKISIKKAKSLKENKEAEKITNKFPGNVEIAKEMLSLLGNESVKIEEAKDTETSLYIAITNKISIADMKNNMEKLNGWLHRRIRMCIWKQWKPPGTRKRGAAKRFNKTKADRMGIL